MMLLKTRLALLRHILGACVDNGSLSKPHLEEHWEAVDREERAFKFVTFFLQAELLPLWTGRQLGKKGGQPV